MPAGLKKAATILSERLNEMNNDYSQKHRSQRKIKNTGRALRYEKVNKLRILFK